MRKPVKKSRQGTFFFFVIRSLKSASSIFYKHTRPNSENLTTTYLFEKFNGSEKCYRNSQRHENTPLIIGPQTYWTKFDTAKKSTSYWKELARLRYWRSIEFEFLEPQITKFFSKTKKKSFLFFFYKSMEWIIFHGWWLFNFSLTIFFGRYSSQVYNKRNVKKLDEAEKNIFKFCTLYLLTYLAA